ncbi:MAG: manganese efflux pump [Alistipes sp.]|nr:manganese efflux pump [Alistipes sp.]
MGIVELLLIAIGLAMDAFAVSVGKGVTLKRVTMRHALNAGVWFGGFQALMPIVGYIVGVRFSSFVTSIDHWIAFGLLVVIGLNMIREAVWGDEESHTSDFGTKTMLLMAIATSIDALAIGISLAFLGVNIWVSAAVIGIVTLLLSGVGVYLGSLFGSRLGTKAGIVGGIILIAIGLKILIEHLEA